MKTRITAVLSILCVGLSGGLPGQTVSQQLESRGPDQYVVRPGDVLRVQVWPDRGLGGDFPVEQTGSVFLPGVGEVSVAGIAVGELREELRRLYGEGLRSPVVVITPLFRVSVIGAVMGPGIYQLDPSQTLFDAISLAGGFSERADQGKVRLIRAGSTYGIDAEQSLETGGGFLDIGLLAGDRIVVPFRSRIGASTILSIIQSVAIIVTLASTIGG